MLKRILLFALAVLLIHFSLAAPVTARTSVEKDQRHAAKVKAAIAKLGVGERARVEVKLRDKTKLRGYISEAGEESFVLFDPTTAKSTTVAYPQVKGVLGNNLSTGAKIAIGLGIAACVLIFLALLIDD